MAQEFEAAAVELIRSRLGDRVDRAARLHAVGRREAARGDFDLLQCVGKRQRKVGPVVRVVVHGAVERVGQRERLSARDRDSRAARHALVARYADLSGPAAQRNQVGDLPAVQRQLENSRVLDHLAHARTARLHHRGVGLDRHALSELTDLEDDVDDRARVDLQHDPGLREGSKARQGHFQAIGAERKIRQDVRARFICDAAADDTGLRLCRSDRHTRQDSARLVRDPAADLRRRLRQGIGADGQ
jgi:hypothetical protein